MKLTFICNQNQARSQVLSSVFAPLLTNFETTSFGLIAREGTPLPIVIESVFHYWGFDPSGRFAKNMGLHWDEIQGMSIIVAVTSFIAQEVRARGFRGEILDLEQEADRLGITLVDPQLMPRRQCAFELAKYLKVCVSAFQRTGVIKKGSKIVAYMPEEETAIEKAVAMALAQAKGGSSVLFGDLIAPVSPLVLESSAALGRFKVDETNSSVELVNSPQGIGIFLPKSAARRPAEIYLSRSWQEFVLKIDTESLIIVTPPQNNSTGRLAESYLAALYADEIQLVPS